MPEQSIKTAERMSQRSISRIVIQFLASLLAITGLAWYSLSVQASALSRMQADVSFFSTASQHRHTLGRISRRAMQFGMPVSVVDETARGQLRNDLIADRAMLRRLQPQLDVYVANMPDGPSTASSRNLSSTSEGMRSILSGIDGLIDNSQSGAEPSKVFSIGQACEQVIRSHHDLLDDSVFRIRSGGDTVGLIGLRAGIGVTLVSLFLVLGVVIPTARRLRHALGASVTVAKELEGSRDELARLHFDLERQHRVLETQSRRLSESLEDAEEQKRMFHNASLRFQSLFQGLPVGCLTFNHDAQIVEWNKAMSQLLQTDAHTVLFRTLAEVMCGVADPRQIGLLQNMVADGLDYPDSDWEYFLEDGTKRYFRVAAYPLRGVDGEVVGGIVNLLDISERREIEEQIRQKNEMLAALASQDGLTGLMNHITLQKTLELAVVAGRPLAFVLLDVDHFKQYNDSFGHPAGDEVLRRVADILRRHAGPDDSAARYGGEEFALILVDRTPDEVLLKVEQIRMAFEAETWPNRQVTASFGISVWSGAYRSHRELIEAADRALYRSKSNGRNRASVADDPAQAA